MSFLLEDGVTFGYDDNKPPVLRDLSGEVPPGITAVVGVSGVGKSTLLNLLGLLWEGPLRHGDIRYGGADYSRMSHARRAELRRTEFGFVPQSSYLLPHLSCAQNLQLPLIMQGMSPRQARAQVAGFLANATFADLDRNQNNYGDQVSGGQRQRFAVLRAIIHNPRVVFADEPVSNLDADNARSFRDLLQQWVAHELPLLPDRGPRTLVLVCHDETIATALADQFFVLQPGKDGATGTVIPNEPKRFDVEQLRQRIRNHPM